MSLLCDAESKQVFPGSDPYIVEYIILHHVVDSSRSISCDIYRERLGNILRFRRFTVRVEAYDSFSPGAEPVISVCFVPDDPFNVHIIPVVEVGFKVVRIFIEFIHSASGEGDY